MKEILISQKKTILLLLFFSIFQPLFDILLFIDYGPANTCVGNGDCLVIEQTFFKSITYIFMPLGVLSLVMFYFKLNIHLRSSIISILFGFIALLKINLMLFDDRIAAWSTYTEQETLMNTIILSLPTLPIQMIILKILLTKCNKK